MNEEKKISELIQKFITDQISTEELQQLSRYLNQEGNSSEIEAYSREKWQNDKKIYNIRPDQIWSKIKGKIAEDKVIRISFQATAIKTIYRIAGYAAIFAAFLLASWLIYRSFTNNAGSVGNVYSEFMVPYGSKSSVILPDGTKVRLNSGSKIKYADDFIKSNRVIFLEGEAFFIVKHAEKVPFVVKTSELNIRVYGTQFNVKSFQEEKNVEMALVSGSVVIEKVDKKGNIVQNIKLKPNQIITYSKTDDRFLLKTSEIPTEDKSKHEQDNQNIEPVITTEPVISQSMEKATSWINNRLTFRGDSIYDLISKLQRWYGVEIALKNKNLNKSTFTGTFDNETIEQALNALKLTTHFSYTIDKNKIIIY
jgi:transmembrane sensor